MNDQIGRKKDAPSRFRHGGRTKSAQQEVVITLGGTDPKSGVSLGVHLMRFSVHSAKGSVNRVTHRNVLHMLTTGEVAGKPRVDQPFGVDVMEWSGDTWHYKD